MVELEIHFSHGFARISTPGEARLTLVTHKPIARSASRPGGRDVSRIEESPGSTEKRWRLTAAGGDPRESATEIEPPIGLRAEARVKRCGKSAPRLRQRRWQGKPHREQDRIGMTRPRGQGSPARVIRVDCLRRGASRDPEEWPPRRGNPALQNPAYRPTGDFFSCFDVPCHSRRGGAASGNPSQPQRIWIPARLRRRNDVVSSIQRNIIPAFPA